MITKISGQCQRKLFDGEGCDKQATDIVYCKTYNPEPMVLCCCLDCSKRIVGQDWPEYVVSCPNCDCGFGVN